MLSVLHLSFPATASQIPACSVSSDAFPNESMTMTMCKDSLVYNNTMCSMVSMCTTKHVCSRFPIDSTARGARGMFCMKLHDQYQATCAMKCMSSAMQAEGCPARLRTQDTPPPPPC